MHVRSLPARSGPRDFSPAPLRAEHPCTCVHRCLKSSDREPHEFPWLRRRTRELGLVRLAGTPRNCSASVESESALWEEAETPSGWLREERRNVGSTDGNRVRQGWIAHHSRNIRLRTYSNAVYTAAASQPGLTPRQAFVRKLIA